MLKAAATLRKFLLQIIDMGKFLKNEDFFEAKNFSLLNGDCIKLMKKIPEKSVDMIFADPPYFLSDGGVSCHSGVQVSVDKGEWDKTIEPKDKLRWNCKWLIEARRVLKDNGTIWISGTFHNIYSVGVALELEGFSIINNITWIKPNPTPNLACRCFTNSTETILWARKQLSPKKKGHHYFDYLTMKKINGGKQMKDAWLMPLPKVEEKKEGKHPTQKPIALLERIIVASTKEGDVILDPFNGSGTTGIAAYRLKRKYIGIDIEKDYLELTKRRFLSIK